jgi:hypothetical protein
MSLDFAMISRMIVDSIAPKKESFYVTDTTTGTVVTKGGADVYIGATEKNILNVLTWVISFMISILAFWLSWSCNTAMGYHIALKALFGAGAFFFGLIYLVLYFIMRWDVCSGSMGLGKYNRKL